MSSSPLTICITGAGSGLGRELSLHFARAGHTVLVTDLDQAAARETLSLMREQAGESSTHRLDVASPRDVEAFAAGLDERAIDVLINNAGLQYVARLEDFPQEQWDRLLDVMLKGACMMTRAVLPPMRRAGYGRIVNIGSIHSLVASPFKTAYCAAKHGLLGFAKVVALETGDVDVTINTICPSYIRTPLVDKQIKAQAATHGMSEDEVIERIMLEPMPKKAFITPAEVAGAIEFLMSPAARNVSGQTITIDGGWTAR